VGILLQQPLDAIQHGLAVDVFTYQLELRETSSKASFA
jgi:hypothetical protein